MSEPIYVESNRCMHFDVRGGKCQECGAELRWVVPVENEPSPLVKIKVDGPPQQSIVSGDDV